MIAIARTSLVVLAITLVVWLFAEAESLAERAETTRFRLVIPQDEQATLALELPASFQGQLSVELRGTRASLDAARRILSEGVTLTPEQAGLATTDGPQQINLLRVLTDYQDLTEQRVEVLAVRPPTLTVIRTELTEIQLPVTLETGTINLEAPPTITPSTVAVRLPARTPQDLYQSAQVTAFLPLTFDQSDEQPGTPSRVERLELALPPQLRLRPHTTIVGDPRVNAEFTIASTTATQTFDAVYTWVVLPWDQADQWAVEVAPESQVRAVTLQGPAEVLRDLTRRQSSIVAAVTLSFDDLIAGTATRTPTLFIRTERGLEPLPQGVSPLTPPATVSLSATQRQSPASETQP